MQEREARIACKATEPETRDEADTGSLQRLHAGNRACEYSEITRYKLNIDFPASVQTCSMNPSRRAAVDFTVSRWDADDPNLFYSDHNPDWI